MFITYKKAVVRLFAICLMLLLSAPVLADYYKYVGPRGDVVFTDKPMESPYVLVWQKDNQFVTTVKNKLIVDTSAKSSEDDNFKVTETKVTVAKVKSKKVKHKSRVDFKSMPKNRSRYTKMINEIAEKSRLYPSLLHAVIKAESAYDPNAISRAGAVGLMQLMPQTAKRFGVKDRRDPRDNLQGGARYLRELLTLYDNNLKLALAAYNAGEKAVKKYGNKIPPYPETQNYVKKVLAFYIQNRRKLAQAD
jgi:membrane-bound lytic murein transglycosylase MltF